MTMTKMTRKETELKVLNEMIWDLPTPANLSYAWNMGSTLGIVMMIQVLTGLILSMGYVSLSEASFNSIVLIMKDMESGWILRFMHMNGASVFFILIYTHMARGLYYQSYSNKKTWLSGSLILIILMMISFLGYVLPWGQMSYWAVAVITNLFSVIPLVGEALVQWIWGGFSVGKPTLIRFYSLHFLMPMVLTAMIMIHLMALHKLGSSNSLGSKSNMDKVNLHPFYTLKDVFFFCIVLTSALSISFFKPYLLGDSVNNTPANPSQTPIHIMPEWYFLTSYAILRSLPSKSSGVMALAASVMIFAILPAFKTSFSSKFNYIRIMAFFVMIASFAFLTKMGSLTTDNPFPLMSQIGAVIYMNSMIIMCL